MFPPFKPLLASLLSPCRSMFLLNNIVAAGCGNHLLTVDVCKARDLPDRSPVTAELVGVDNLWDIEFNQQLVQKGLRRLGIPMPLENTLHEIVLVHSPPQPVSDAVHACTRPILSANSEGQR